jgi:pyruvate/2-oxoglutarate dehydrogenase complex dihydrolipoamide acyltransferase (E2) component
MPSRFRRPGTLLVTALLALAPAGAVLPAPASAQSAGDDQYQDPFAGDDQGQSQGGSGGGGGGSEPAPAAPAPAPAAPAPAATPAPAAASGVAPAAAAPAPAQLPYTGLDAGPILLVGAVLLASGVALRLRLRLRERT